MIRNEIYNQNLKDYSREIGLLIFGEYTVYLENNIYFKFDGYEDNGWIRLYNNGKDILTKINPEILNRVKEKVDVKLTENIQMFKTEKITVIDKWDKQHDFESKAIIEYILELCKGFYIKELKEQKNIEKPDYKIDFNNGVEIYKYSSKDNGYLLKDNMVYEIYGMQFFSTILENAFNKAEELSKSLRADRVNIVTPTKNVEITDEYVVDKITSFIIYSSIHDDGAWLENYDISEEYNSGIKIKINNYEFLIPGDKHIGNRFLITENGKILSCFPLIDLEAYVETLI